MANNTPNVPIPTFKQPIYDGTNTTRPWYFFFQSLYARINAIATGVTFTDGTHTVAAATKLTVTGGTIGGASPNATLSVTGGGSGTVTSVGFADTSSAPIYTITNSPVTTSGTIDQTLNTQSANTVFAGPTTGAAAQPAFRSLVAADVTAVATGAASNITTITQAGGASQTYNVPPGANAIEVICIGGGGGGAAGARIGTSGGVDGGAGGGAGGVSYAVFRAADLGSSVTVTFSNAATGGNGAPPTTTSSQGATGVAGSNVSFGGRLIALGGAVPAGGGGNGTSAGGGAGNIATGTASGGGGAAAIGANGVAPTSVSYNATSFAPTGGGGGGGTTTGTSFAGGTGGAGSLFMTLVGGTGGTAGGGNGGNGVAGSGTQPASGGGGGGSTSNAVNGGTGGNGGNFGGGGGGGGSSYTTATQSGGGGNGGLAACIIIAY